MINKRYFVSYAEVMKGFTFTVENPFIRKTIEQYAWNCRGGFILFHKIARLAEINAPATLLKEEMCKMADGFKRAGFAKNEIAKVKKWLYDEYPDLQKKIRNAKIPKNQA